MPFHWFDREQHELELEHRYDGGEIAGHAIWGGDAWSEFVSSITPMNGLDADDRESTPATISGHETLSSSLRKFREAANSEGQQGQSSIISACPVVFVSHQRSDAAEAERIAERACRQGIDYWLDIHDPLLKLANRIIRPNDVRYPFIIAAIIEMALLNSSHLIAVHTTNSLASKWVPYELGRVRDRNIQSANAGGWFHPNLLPRQCGDYVNLCRIMRLESDIDTWLNGWPGGRRNVTWQGKRTTPLPN